MRGNRALCWIAGLVFAAGCGSSKSEVESNKNDSPKPVVKKQEKPPETPSSPAAKCAAGDRDACDELQEFWGERQILRDALAKRGRDDAAGLHKGCDDKRLSSACMGLALMYKYGTAGEPDKATSNKYWGEVATLGDLNGFRGKDKSDEGAKALAATQKECDEGRARACNQAGWAAFGAIQRDKDVRDAFSFYDKGCKLGSGAACRWAGHFAYTYSKQIEGADPEALLRRGCDAGAPGSCTELGLYLEKQMGDLGKATEHYRSACEQGAREGCALLATAIESAKGDPVEAFGHRLEACEAGEKPACETMATKVGAKCDFGLPGKAPADLAAKGLAAARRFCEKADPKTCRAALACK